MSDKYGAPHCDASGILMADSLSFIRDSLRPDLVISTGDLVGHYTYEFDTADQALDEACAALAGSLGKLPVLLAFGNHDTKILDQDGNPWLAASNNKRYVACATPWPTMAAAQWPSGGFTYDLSPYLPIRVVGLNTLMWDTHNAFLHRGMREDEARRLQAAYASLPSNTTVWVVGHMPPHTSEATPGLAKLLGSVANRTSAFIFGHTHWDDLRGWCAQGSDAGPVIVAGSIKFAHGARQNGSAALATTHTPWVRAYRVRPSDGLLLGYTVYSGTPGPVSMVWAPYYDTARDLGMSNLTTSGVLDLYMRAVTNATLYETFARVALLPVCGGKDVGCRRAALSTSCV